MKTLNHDDEFTGPAYGWDGGALTVTPNVIAKTVAKIVQIRRDYDQIIQVQTDAAWASRKAA